MSTEVKPIALLPATCPVPVDPILKARALQWQAEEKGRREKEKAKQEKKNIEVAAIRAILEEEYKKAGTPLPVPLAHIHQRIWDLRNSRHKTYLLKSCRATLGELVASHSKGK